MITKIEIDWNTVSRELKRKLDERGWTFRVAEDHTGVDYSTICRVACGRRCSVEVYLSLCRALRWDPMRPAFVGTDGAEA